MTGEQPTSDRLADALAQIPGLPPAMIARARRGYYDDYKSELPFPQSALIDDLKRTKLPAARVFCQRVINGEFDGTKAEAEAWAQTSEGQQAMGQLLGKFFQPPGRI